MPASGPAYLISPGRPFPRAGTPFTSVDCTYLWQIGANALAPALLRNDSETRAFATAAGRVGIAANQALFYVKGGGAWADDTFFISSAAAPNVPLQLSDSTRWGCVTGTQLNRRAATAHARAARRDRQTAP